ncbi:uncharacterized protein LOC142768869 [Rhipicephalus microplus]|uniref:uncharacterized protein LOC142768869 n=1 Tax=Rhipicephalus microplus TaxID=6941 RepID=UPI003F6CC847
MSLLTAPMELLQEFGDPRVLVLAEDHIVLKMRTPWPRDVPVPEGLSLADNDGLLLVLSQESLISTSRNGLPLGTRILKALFCSCAPFKSSLIYASAATELLHDPQSVCVVHNRDQVYTLIRMFPNARVLALPHDLCVHAFKPSSKNGPTPLVARSQLRELLGGAYAECNISIIMHGDVLDAILTTCPKIRRINSYGVCLYFLKGHGSVMPTMRARPENFNHLLIYSTEAIAAIVGQDAPLVDKINFAVHHFPFVERLQVVMASLVPLPKFAAFRHLRSLEIIVHMCAEIPDVDSALTGLLTKRPGLEELGLFRGSGVRLSTIARLCPKLKSLKLLDCLGSPEDVPVEAQAFSNLQCVQIDLPLAKTCFDAFFSATRSRLRTARFRNNLCAEFLHHAVQCSDRLPFPCLENLTLNTKESLSQLKLKAEDLPNFAKALPALRHLETDIFELRLFVENFYTPRGQVTLSWSGCVYCDVHRPNMDAAGVTMLRAYNFNK